MAGQSPLRRWKPFFAAFGQVDAAIEAAGPALCRDEFRSARGDVVELLCGVPAGDGGRGAGPRSSASCSTASWRSRS